MDHSAEQAGSTLTDDEVRRLLRETNPELPEDPPGQAELLAWLARETRDQWRLDRLWILTVALPTKGWLVRSGLRAPTDARGSFAAGAVVATLTIGVLRYLLRRSRLKGAIRHPWPWPSTMASGQEMHSDTGP